MMYIRWLLKLYWNWKLSLSHTHHICWYLLHLGGRCTRSGVELVDEETGESVAFHQVYRLLEVFLCLTGKTADYIGSDGYTWDPKGETDRERGGRSGSNIKVVISWL